jgi:pilus assembly protein Flp/PilA
MQTLYRLIGAIAGDRRAVTSIEYGLIAAVMGLLIVNGITTLGTKMNTAFGTIGTTLVTKASGM